MFFTSTRYFRCSSSPSAYIACSFLPQSQLEWVLANRHMATQPSLDNFLLTLLSFDVHISKAVSVDRGNEQPRSVRKELHVCTGVVACHVKVQLGFLVKEREQQEKSIRITAKQQQQISPCRCRHHSCLIKSIIQFGFENFLFSCHWRAV